MFLEAITVNSSNLTASNLTENDASEWSSGTAYVVNDEVILTSTSRVYRALAANTNSNPAAAGTTDWVEIGTTNLWRAFDNRVGNRAIGDTSTITYEITPASRFDTVAFIGISAVTVRLEVIEGTSTVYDQTITLADTSSIVAWYSYFHWAANTNSLAIFNGVTGNPGSTARITISSTSGTPGVSEVLIGQIRKFGDVTTNTEIGYEDLSVISRDSFGNISVVERPFYRTTSFSVAIPTGTEGSLLAALTRVRARPTLFYCEGDETNARGTVIYGLPRPLRIPLQGEGISFATLDIEEVNS